MQTLHKGLNTNTERDKGIGYVGLNGKDNANYTLFDERSRSAVAK